MHVVACFSKYFISFCDQMIFQYMDISYFLYLSISEWPLGGFHIWAVMTNPATNIYGQRSVWTCVYISLGWIGRSGIAES